MENTRIAIIYGSTTGTTKEIASRIAKIMGIEDKDVYNVKDVSPSILGDYDKIIVGSSTWGNGDLQEDWYDFVDGLKAVDLPETKVAIYGCGDETMSDTFCNAVARLYHAFKETGARMVGAYDVVGYDFNHTDAEIDGTVVGLLLDEVNHPEATNLRLRSWCNQLKEEFKD